MIQVARFKTGEGKTRCKPPETRHSRQNRAEALVDMAREAVYNDIVSRCMKQRGTLAAGCEKV